jgi:hypothetical protein
MQLDRCEAPGKQTAKTPKSQSQAPAAPKSPASSKSKKAAKPAKPAKRAKAAGGPKIVRDDVYEEMASTYQVIEIARLNEVLKKHKLTAKVRRAICEAYFFDNGVFLDCGWLTAADTKVFATLCFAERPLDPDEGLGEIETLYVPSEFFSFHEYAGGDVGVYFDEQEESVADIEHGNL